MGKKNPSTQWQHHTGLGILAFTRVSCEVVHCRDYVGVSEEMYGLLLVKRSPYIFSVSGSTKTLCIGWEGHLLGGTSPIPLSSEHTE